MAETIGKKNRNWFSEVTPERLLADGISAAIIALAASLALGAFGLLKALEVSTGWAIFTAACVLGIVCSGLALYRRLRESPPGSMASRINELAAAAAIVANRDQAEESARFTYNTLLGMGLRFHAAEFADTFPSIVKSEVPEPDVVRMARRSAGWLRGLASRIVLPQSQDQSKNAAASIVAIDSCLSALSPVKTKDQAWDAFDIIADNLRLVGLLPLLDELRSVMRLIHAAEPSDDIAQEVSRLRILLQTSKGTMAVHATTSA